MTPLDYILSCLRRAADNACPWSLTPTEAGSLVAEVEKLRVERDHFREAWAAAQARLDCGVDAADAVREDRAALIRWLGLPPQTYLDGYLLVGSIERGEHRKGKP